MSSDSRRSFSLSAVITICAISVSSSASALLLFQAFQRKRARRELTEGLTSMPGSPSVPAVSMIPDSPVRPIREVSDQLSQYRADPKWQESLVQEQLSRNTLFLGESSMHKIRSSFVVVVGCGGVGSHAATMLIRSGVGKVRLIDFDQVSLSSLNRHATAVLKDVGISKVSSIRNWAVQTAPWCHIDDRQSMWNLESADELLEGNPDWVLDAIDNLQTKVDLISYCHKRNLKVFSSMGAGAKADPSRVQIADISDTFEDPLARVVRRDLKLKGVINGVPVVYSTEAPTSVCLAPLPEEEFQKGKVKELSPFDDFRVRLLPVLGPLPAIFGLVACTYLLMKLGEKDIELLACTSSKKTGERIWRDLRAKEERKSSSPSGFLMCVSEFEVILLVDDIYKRHSAIPPYNIMAKPNVVRWDNKLPLSPTNICCMTKPEAERHELECAVNGKSMREVWGSEACAHVESRLEEMRRAMWAMRG